MTITYDAEGKCTRCGSAGYTPERVYDVSGEATDIRSLVPCPCHGWRPIEFAPKDREVDLLMPLEAFGELRMYPGEWDSDRYARTPRPYWTSFIVARLWGIRFMRANQPTHFRPRPQPPEGV